MKLKDIVICHAAFDRMLGMGVDPSSWVVLEWRKSLIVQHSDNQAMSIPRDLRTD